MSQYRRFNVAKFTSLISLVPVEIFVTFNMADNPDFYNYLGLSLIVPLFFELLLQVKLSGILDTYSRKTVLVFNELVNSAILLSVLIYILFLRPSGILPDFIVLISVEFFYFIAYQTYMAYAKEIVDNDSMSKYNGLAEILGQLPVLIGTFSASLIFLKIGLTGLLAIAVALHCVVVFQLLGIKEAFGKEKKISRENKVTGSFKYMIKNFRNVLFIFLLNFPFMAIIAGNFLKPIFMASYLHGNASLLADSTGIYALTAILAGYIAPKLMHRIGEMRSVFLFSAIFFAGSVLMPAFPILLFYFVFQVFHGFGNPGVRIARNSMAMRSTPLEEMGRFNGSVSMLTIMGRMLVIGFCLVALNYIGVQWLLFIIGLLVLGATAAAGMMWIYNPELQSRFSLPGEKLSIPQ